MRMRSTWLPPLLLLLSVMAGAQASTTSLRGSVTDPKGFAVVGATVTLASPETGFSRTAQTDKDGIYQFLSLPPGAYAVSVTAKGFSTYKNSAVRLLVDTPTTLNIPLTVGSETTTVEVRAEAPLVNTTDATMGHAFTAKEIGSLPFEGQNVVDMLSLQAGVVYTGNNPAIDTGGDSRSGAVNGARSDQTNLTLDGIDNNHQLTGEAFTGVLRMPLDAVQEFRVTTANANADAGRSSGAQVTVVSKTGTNNWHGGVYYFHRPTITVANDWFNKHAQLNSGEPNRPPKLIRNTFGASVGGPIIKDRLFFFAAYSGLRRRENQQVLRTVPSDDLRNGFISYECSDDPACPASGIMRLSPADIASMDPNCTGNGTCPLGPGANPAVMAVLQQYPSPNTDQGTGDGLNFRGFTFSAPNPYKEDTYLLRLDYNLTPNGNHKLFVRGNLQNDHGAGTPQFPGDPPNETFTANNKGIAAGYTALFRSNLINSFRYGFIREGIGRAGADPQFLVHFRGLDDINGGRDHRTTAFNVPVHHFVDDVTWTKGSHTIQFGGNLRLIHNNRASNAQNFFGVTTNASWTDAATLANVPGGASLDPAAFGFPAVDEGFAVNYSFPMAALAGLLVQVDSIYNVDKAGTVFPQGTLVPRHFKSWEAEWYVQDSWRIKPNFTLTVGLRHSLLQPPYETAGNQVAPSVSLNDWFNQRWINMLQGVAYNPGPISLDLSGQANGGKPYWDWDYKDLAPRVAIAYSPGFEHGWLHGLFGGPGKTSIRAGFGMFYDHFGQGVVNSFDRQGSFGLTTQITNPAGDQVNNTVDCVPRFTALGDLPGNTCTGLSFIAPAPSGFPATPPAGFDNGSFAITWGLDDKLKTPYSYAIDLSITRELPHNFVFEAAYVGRMAHRLLQEEDLAMPLDLVDPTSRVNYFTAASQLSLMAEAGTPVTSVTPIPYWENLFPAAAGANLLSGNAAGNAPCAPPGTYVAGQVLTATQNMYDNYFCFLHNETTALFIADLFCFPGGANVASNFPCAPNSNAFVFFDDQWSSLYAWRSIGRSNYHAGQFSLRMRTTPLDFTINYTLSKSIDIGSNAERVNIFENSDTASGLAAYNSQILNSWQPFSLRAVSDYDTRHQINANWIWQLPVGKGHRWGGDWGGVAEAILGGWQFSGLYRWTSGFPFSVSSGANWGTNWELSSNGILTGSPGQTGFFIDGDGDANVFQNKDQALAAFRYPLPGESGQRNVLRGQGYFNIDVNVAKTWHLTERQTLSFNWATYNMTNSVRFDAASIGPTLDASSNFGKYTTTLTQPRRMEFGLRYSF